MFEKFVFYVEKIKDNIKCCVVGWVSFWLVGLMDKDLLFVICFVFFMSEGKVCEYMVCMELGFIDIM